MSSVLPIARTTRATLIAEDMREHLLSGAVAPGTPLGDEDLAQATGAPVGTVRAALSELERDGLVVHSLHRGLEVTPITRAEVKDIYSARRVYERAGLDAMLSTLPVDVSWLQAAIERMGEAAVSGDHRALVESEMAFHLALVAAAGSSRVTRAAQAVLMELRLVLPVADRYDRRPAGAGGRPPVPRGGLPGGRARRVGGRARGPPRARRGARRSRRSTLRPEPGGSRRS